MVYKRSFLGPFISTELDEGNTMNTIAEIYNQASWGNFFLMVGGGSAALTGLVFVAMSINHDLITKDAAHRYRATGTLTGLTAVFVRCALVLMGSQNYRLLAIELGIVTFTSAYFFFRAYLQASRSEHEPGLRRTMHYGSFFFLEIFGALLLFSGRIVGLYIVAMSILVSLVLMIFGAWQLVVGVYDQE